MTQYYPFPFYESTWVVGGQESGSWDFNAIFGCTWGKWKGNEKRKGRKMIRKGERISFSIDVFGCGKEMNVKKIRI